MKHTKTIYTINPASSNRFSEKLEIETHKTSYTINPASASSNRCTYFDKHKSVICLFFNMTQQPSLSSPAINFLMIFHQIIRLLICFVLCVSKCFSKQSAILAFLYCFGFNQKEKNAQRSNG